MHRIVSIHKETVDNYLAITLRCMMAICHALTCLETRRQGLFSAFHICVSVTLSIAFQD
jgi:hypothetical protein